ncbi:MAG: efflux RND transporter periplasmic adaptor subunit, partial [Gammaproteobacteria bacterium]|nr:efflux RND transporter periplasmic adaptor subunit [Gammaproteobacteria bacterium]
LLLVAAAFGAIFGYTIYQQQLSGGYFANYRPPPVSVAVAAIRSETWRPYLTAIGTLDALYGVDVSAEVDGIVEEILFTSGQEVKRGDLIIQLDDSVEQANLASFQAQLRLARVNYGREEKMMEKRLSAQGEMDRRQAELESAAAQVEQTRAIIAKKKIRAPFVGRIGIRKVDLGQFISAGDAIASLQAVETLYLDFSIPEQSIPRLFIGQAAYFTVDAYDDREFTAELVAIDSNVDSATRNILVRAQVENKEDLLVPGMFAAVRLELDPPVTVLSVPNTAVTYSLYGDFVFVVEEESVPEGGAAVLRVKRRAVTTGMRQNNRVAIAGELQAGQRVVIDGQLKLNNGAEIVIANPPVLESAALR